MALAIDASSPAVVQGSTATTSTASFSPPAQSAIVAFVAADANTGATNEQCTVSDSLSALTWNLGVRANGGVGTTVEVWWAYAATAPGSLTVNVVDNQGAVAKRMLVRVFTGANTTVIGATGTGATGSIAYTSTGAGSWGWGTWIGPSSFSADTNQTLEDVANGTGPVGDSVATTKQNSTTTNSGTSVTMSVVSGGNPYHAVAVEILAAATSGTPSAPAFNFTPPGLKSPFGTLTPFGYDQAQSTAATQTVLPAAVASNEAFGNPTVSTTYTITPVGVGSTEAFGNPTVSTSNTLTPIGVATSEAFGNPTVSATYTVTPTGVPSTEAFGNLAVSANVAPVGIPSSEAFGNPTVTPGSVTIAPFGVKSEEKFGNPTVQVGASLISPIGVGSSEAFGNPTVTPGTVTISPTGVASAERFGNPTVSATYTVAAFGITSQEKFGNPAVSPGTVTVTAIGIATSEAFGNPVVTGMGQLQTVLAFGISSSEAFGNPNVARAPDVVSDMSMHVLRASLSTTQLHTVIAQATVATDTHE